MTKKKQPTERAEDKGEGSASAAKLETIERFKRLARKLVNVPRDKLEKEHENYEAERSTRTSRIKTRKGK